MRISWRWWIIVAAALLLAWLFWRNRGITIETPSLRPTVPQTAAPTSSVPASASMEERFRGKNLRRQSPVVVSNEMIAVVAGGGQSPSNYLGRMAAIQRLPAILSTNDAVALRQWLAAPYTPSNGMRLLEFNGVKNAVADLLLRQPEVSSGLIADFAAMFYDESYDVVWRDYCLQFLGASLELVMTPAADSEITVSRDDVLAVLREATGLRTTTFAGTALLALNTVVRRGPDNVTTSEVASLAVGVAKDTQASEACRITALRVAGMTGAAAVLPVARELAQTAGTETLRQAAIATIGDLGGADDQELLDALAHESDRAVATIAAQAALNLKKRLPPQTVAPAVAPAQ